MLRPPAARRVHRAALRPPFAAAAQGELVVYCTVQEEWCRPMVAAFEKAPASRC
jgi:hypothetical protein